MASLFQIDAGAEKLFCFFFEFSPARVGTFGRVHSDTECIPAECNPLKISACQDHVVILDTDRIEKVCVSFI